MFNYDNMVKIVESCGVHVYDTEVATEFDKRIFRLYITIGYIFLAYYNQWL